VEVLEAGLSGLEQDKGPDTCSFDGEEEEEEKRWSDL